MLDVPLKLDFAANANDNGFNAKFFNSKQNVQDMSETVLPQASQQKLQKNANAFDAFSKQSRKI
jgi:hypothetical protein